MKTGFVAFAVQIISGVLLSLFDAAPVISLGILHIPTVVMVLLWMFVAPRTYLRMVAPLVSPSEVGDPPWDRLSGAKPPGGWLTGPWSWGIYVPVAGLNASKEELGRYRKSALQFWLGAMLTFFGAGVGIAVWMITGRL
jgi:hypothetical protein